jgi:hypothetical protein
MTVTLTPVGLPTDYARAAMKTVTPYRPRYTGYRDGFDIDTLFWGALIFLALFLSWFLAWKAIERLRNRKTSAAPSQRTTSAAAATDAVTALPPLEAGPTKAPEDPYASTFPQSWARYGDGEMGGMNEREEEEFFLAFGTRKHCKAIKERQKAREQSQTRGGQTS